MIPKKKEKRFKASDHTSILFQDIAQLIEQSKKQVAQTINSAISLLYWKIGKRIVEEVLQNDRAEYGKKIIPNLSKQLENQYGKSFSEKNLRRMIQFAEIFPEKKIVVSLIRQLSWTHILAIIPIQEPLKRDFYIEICIMKKWSTRVLQNRINSLLYERTAISKNPVKAIKKILKDLKQKEELDTDLIFRDPYVLDFLELNDAYSEKDLESSIIKELQNFIIELGNDFAFLARQKRITIDNRVNYCN